MQTAFLWFYCLSIPRAVGLLILATLAFLFLRNRFSNTLLWKIGIPLLFTLWVGAILYGTLWLRTESSSVSDPILVPFHSYFAALNGGPRELYRGNFMNTVLFYPAGLLGCELPPRRMRRFRNIAILTCLLMVMSIGIECSQYRFALGLLEADDIIHNTFGALLGAVVCTAPSRKR